MCSESYVLLAAWCW